MNKVLKAFIIAAVACVAITGTTFAGPGGHGRGHRPAPRHHVVKHRTPPKRHVVKHHKHHRPPRIVHRCHHKHYHRDCRWCVPPPPPCVRPALVINL